MQNFDLLKAVGKMTKPILLKRGLSAATIEEWIMSAEYYIMALAFAETKCHLLRTWYPVLLKNIREILWLSVILF